MAKVRVNVTISEKNYRFARELGLNISQFLNNRLDELRTKINPENSKPEGKRAGRESNPSERDLQSRA